MNKNAIIRITIQLIVNKKLLKMKKLIFTLGIIIIVTNTILAQAPQSFKYQAIARDVEGNHISDQQVSLKINLLRGDKTGQLVYSEVHDLRTSPFGLINLEIGMGENKSGEISAINWALSKYFVNVEIDINGGNNYKSMGVSQLLSVPYALYAETTGSFYIPEQAMSWTDGASETYLTNSGWNVGIGTSSPSSKLEVVGKGAFENVYGSITDVSTASGHVVSNKLEVLYAPTISSAVKGSTVQIKAITADPAVTNFTNFLQGLRFSLIHRNNGTIAQFIGGRFQMGMPTGAWGGTGTTGIITSMKGIDMELYGQKGTVIYGTGISLESLGGNFTNLTYLRINQASDVAGNWGIYNNSGYNNYFAGATGIGTANPVTNLHVYESNSSVVPAVLIEQTGTGDASLLFKIGVPGAVNENFTAGIDYNDNRNFKINNAAQLMGTTYNEVTTMMQIHTENPKDGIIDFNHQSRARAWLQNNSGVLSPFAWTAIFFDTLSYDEHSEWLIDPAGITSGFIPTEEGYYQVNARTKILVTDATPLDWCSIAIYVNGAMYAEGNNLRLGSSIPLQPSNNNAPNVSDVVYLQAGDLVEIYVYSTITWPVNLAAGKTQTYCSIHKES